MSPGTAQLKGFFPASAHTCRPSRPPLWPLVSWAWRGGVHKCPGLWGGVCSLTIDALVSCWILQLCPQVVLPEAHSQPLPSSSPPSPLVPHPHRTSAAGSAPSLGSWRPQPPSPPPEALVSCSSTLHPGNLGFRPQGQARGGGGGAQTPPGSAFSPGRRLAPGAGAAFFRGTDNEEEKVVVSTSSQVVLSPVFQTLVVWALTTCQGHRGITPAPTVGSTGAEAEQRLVSQGGGGASEKVARSPGDSGARAPADPVPRSRGPEVLLHSREKMPPMPPLQGDPEPPHLEP